MSSKPAGFRPDLDGLRAVAILIIIPFHAGWSIADGFFVGLDLFFVISGYLITRNLVRESERTGRIALGSFWGRRVLRLVPAMIVMLLGVLALSALLLSPLQWQTVSADARWTALYVSNVHFAEVTSDYFAANDTKSVLLHTWSLGLEEQFYVLWPLIIAVIAWVAAKRKHLERKFLVGAFALTFAVSFALSVVLSGRAPTTPLMHPYYSLPTRAWEFAVAALFALAPVPRILERKSVATAAGIVGFVMIGLGMAFYDPSISYPGPWPLLPVTGTILIIASGAGFPGGIVPKALSWSIAQRLGRLSYSWYLWHWPLMILAILVTGNHSVWLASAAAAAGLIPAALSYRLVEQPLRFHRAFKGSLPRTLALGFGGSLAVIAASILLLRYSDVELNRIAAASAVEPGLRLDEVRASVRDELCPNKEGNAFTCTGGDLDSDTVMLVTGDSHTRGWVPVFFKVGEQRGVKVVARWKPACPAFPVDTVDFASGGLDTACIDHREKTVEMIERLQPDLVVSTTSDDYALLVRSHAWEAAYREWVTDLQATGVVVGSVYDTPRLPYYALECIAEKGVEACAAPSGPALNYGAALTDAEDRVRKDVGNVPTLDVNDVICDDELCHLVRNGTYVFTDSDHMYPPFLLTLEDRVDTFFGEMLDQLDP